MIFIENVSSEITNKTSIESSFFSLIYTKKEDINFKHRISGLVIGRALWDREVPGSIPARGTSNFLEQEINPILLHFTQV